MATWQIQIKGVVQGVGFRPFVHKMAVDLKVRGEVFNNPNGVTVNFNARPEQAQIFYHRLITGPPPLSVITDHHLVESKAKDFTGFVIARSEQMQLDNFRITPDLAMCYECRAEINDPRNRRFGYAFTTCTNCGPRFSILIGLPFDRENTTMSSFKMCDACQHEYTDPKSSRHHSQTNSCAQCGITLQLFDSKTKKKVRQETDGELIEIISDLILQGNIVAVKGIGGFLLICDATNEEMLIELRQRKRRPKKPLALMYPNIEAVQTDYQVSDPERAALQSPATPIVLLQPKSNQNYNIAFEQINPGLDRVGVMLPYAPLFELILQQVKSPIIATSGNVSGSPIIHDNEMAIKNLSSIADHILTHNRDINFPQDDSVVQFTKHSQRRIIIRRARGLAPNYIDPNLSLGKATEMSLGADLKNAFGMVHHGNILISQYLGDISNYEVQENASKFISRFKNLLQQPVDKIIVDKHPNYYSHHLGIGLAKQEQTPILEEQHHLAHFCALLGEHNLANTKDKVLGVIWDGTGFGGDGHIWGSEHFTFQHQQFSRVSHVKYFNAIAGDKLSQEPRLAALSIGFGSTEVREHLKHKFTPEEWRVYTQQLGSVTKLQSSSMGRLFDAVASILDVTDLSTFEGEAAMHLQTLAANYFYGKNLPAIQPYAVFDGQLKLDGGKLMAEIFKDLDSGKERNAIAARFYQTLVHWIEQIAQAQQVKKLAFSGGVFQNPVLVDLIIEQQGEHFELFFHQDLSPNDENIAFGQLIYSSLVNNKSL